MTCPTLNAVVRETVNFDPTNPEHKEAFRMLVLGVPKDVGGLPIIKQHPTLRFTLPSPFTNVRQMMIAHACEAFVK